VLEATCSDPWGPSFKLMSQIAELTFEVSTVEEVMRMIWKRLSEKGKNWRRIYKSLVLVEYLLKEGSAEVIADCRDNLTVLQDLKQFASLTADENKVQDIKQKAKDIIATVMTEHAVQVSTVLDCNIALANVNSLTFLLLPH